MVKIQTNNRFKFKLFKYILPDFKYSLQTYEQINILK